MSDQTIDLSPQNLNLVLYAGDGVRFRLIVTDKDDAPVNLTGTVKAQIRSSDNTDSPSAEFSADLTNAVDGIVVLSLTGEQTQPLAAEKRFKGVWDVEWHPDGDNPRTLCRGSVECNSDVSR